MGHDFRLLVNLLRHEVAMVALVEQKGRTAGLDDGALHRVAGNIENLHTVTRHDGPVALLEIGYLIGEGRERDRVGAKIHFAAAMTDGEGRALARPDHQIVFTGEDESQCESTSQTRQRRAHRINRRTALLHFLRHEMGDDFGVGFGAEGGALFFERLAQLAEILDDAVMHDRKTLGGMRMRVVLGWLAVRRPARMADTGMTGQRLAIEALLQILQFTFGPSALEMTVLHGSNAG